MTYDKFLMYADNEGIEVVEDTFSGLGKGFCIEDTIFINKNIKEVEKRCILAEEIGHVKTSAGNIVNMNLYNNAKQELIARRWAYKKLVGIIDIIKAFEYGAKNRFEIASYLNVTEDFLQEALNYYKCKYGVSYEIDNYIIYFEPNLAILKIF